MLKSARPTMLLQFAMPLSRGVAEAALYCAHRATTASSWGLCEQEGHLVTPLPSAKLARYLSGNGG